MRIQAQRATATAEPGEIIDRRASQAHALIRAKLGADLRRLKGIQSIERKIAVKSELLTDYVDYVDGVLAAKRGVRDDVLCYVLCWRIDVGDYAGALPLARYVLQHNLPLPDRFQRTSATLIAEEPAVQALKAYDAQKPFDVQVLLDIDALTRDRDMPDQVRAKLLFAIGRSLISRDARCALDYLRRAVELYDKVGAKKDIERLERQLKHTTNESPPKGGT